MERADGTLVDKTVIEVSLSAAEKLWSFVSMKLFPSPLARFYFDAYECQWSQTGDDDGGL